MRGYKGNCERCGVVFTAKRRATAPPPRFCSRECYWASGANSASLPTVINKKKYGEVPHGRKRVYLGKVDGKPRHMQRSHWVWNQHHPDDLVRPGEHVHHIDGNPTNDSIDNLAKYTAEDHADLHAAEGSLAGPNAVLSARMKAWHAANPGKNRKGKPRTCPVCGVEFYRPPSAKAETCSYKCMGKLRSIRAGSPPS